MGARIFACYARLLPYCMVNKEKEPCRALAQCSSGRNRRQIRVQKLDDVRKGVFVIHKLIVIEEVNSCAYYASSGNKSETCPIAFEISWPSWGS